MITLGAHSDSVFDGPGINDDGSGSVGILEVAVQLSNYSVNNAVRFCWWSGEEFGLLGSTHYVESLSAADLAKIRLYLNFDMIASPNYIFATFDGDGSAFNLTGPPGSAQIESFFEEWFADRDLGLVPTAFDGRSDYQAFADNGVASGGLFTGADDVKTAEEVRLFGGIANITHDPNYHSALDNYDNLNFTAFTTMTKAIAASVAEYATSVDSLPAGNNTILTRRKALRPLKRRTTDLRKVVKGHYEAWAI